MADIQSLAPEKLIDKLTHATHVGDNRGLEIFAACDDEILKQVLPHCTVDQLKYVEKCLKSKGRDLSPVTDKLWKKFYERKFGVQNANVVTQRMKERKVWYKWVALYEAKLKEASEKANRAIERVGKLYEKEKERKQSRQVKVVTVVSNNNNNKRVCTSEVPNLNKGNLMKKARKEFLNCLEVKNLQAINLQRKYHLN
ncbi:uncharacterized protein LOC142612218 [Castanea sativa]|uniref:uncharacterized protein LOC142612218 n=1 Tax=Castanea sativa TaxID=21020 RepID=UPI003F64B692